MNAPATAPETLTLNIDRRIRAPRERVFEAFTSVDEMKKWMCPGEAHVTEGEMNFEAGGSYHLKIHTGESGMVDLVGEYREIVPNEKIVMTWQWKNNSEFDRHGPTLVTVDFEESRESTHVHLKHEGFEFEDYRQAHDQGWSGTFDKLEKLLA